MGGIRYIRSGGIPIVIEARVGYWIFRGPSCQIDVELSPFDMAVGKAEIGSITVQANDVLKSLLNYEGTWIVALINGYRPRRLLNLGICRMVGVAAKAKVYRIAAVGVHG